MEAQRARCFLEAEAKKVTGLIPDSGAVTNTGTCLSYRRDVLRALSTVVDETVLLSAPLQAIVLTAIEVFCDENAQRALHRGEKVSILDLLVKINSLAP